jgi:hypothetical protein
MGDGGMRMKVRPIQGKARDPILLKKKKRPGPRLKW